MSDSTPGWQADPTGKHDHRYWDGSQWTDNVSDAGVAGTDPYVADAAPDATVADAPAAAVPAAPEPPAPVDPTVVEPAPPAPDATATWPAAPAAPGFPTPPPPYVPTSPVSSGGGGGSKRGLLIGGGILAIIAIVVAIVAMSGGDDEKSDVEAQLASTIADSTGVSDAQAACVARLVVDEAGEDAFKDTDFSASDPPTEFISALLAVGMEKVVDECDIDEEAFSDGGDTTDTTEGSSDGGDGTYGSDPELDALYDSCADGDYAACDELYNSSPSGSEYEEFADSCGDRNEPAGYCVDIYEDGGDSGGLTDGADLPDNYTDILADTYEQSLGLSREQAECLADKLTRAIEGGELSEEDAVAGFMGYLSDCDIDPEEIGAN